MRRKLQKHISAAFRDSDKGVGVPVDWRRLIFGEKKQDAADAPSKTLTRLDVLNLWREMLRRAWIKNGQYAMLTVQNLLEVVNDLLDEETSRQGAPS